MKELDFKQEVTNAELTRLYFKDNNRLHIPENKIKYSGSRSIVMEYVEGCKINDIETLEMLYGDAKKAS